MPKGKTKIVRVYVMPAEKDLIAAATAAGNISESEFARELIVPAARRVLSRRTQAVAHQSAVLAQAN